MSEYFFPSGPWVGFYTYSGNPRKYLMDLMLEFKSERMTGEGADGVGFFVISGNYSEATGDCAWIKQYIKRHTVDYRGYREGKGIWGTWSLPGTKGGFHIWPLSEGARPMVAEATAETTVAVPYSSRLA